MDNRRTVDTIPKVALEGLYHPAEDTVQDSAAQGQKNRRSMMTGTIDRISPKQKKTIVFLARKGCTVSEVGTAQHLREVHAKGSVQTGSQELLNLLRGTVPLVPPADYGGESEDENKE